MINSKHAKVMTAERAKINKKRGIDNGSRKIHRQRQTVLSNTARLVNVRSELKYTHTHTTTPREPV